MGEMGYETIKQYARKELSKPNPYSKNRLAALTKRADIECGKGASGELHREIFSTSDQNHSSPRTGYTSRYADNWNRVFGRKKR